jgi:Rad3-related DNA helicase
MVRSIFVPQSPSGTGKTFRALMSGTLFSSHDVAAVNISLRS